MSSTNTYSQQYCVYITHYSGDLLPQNYIGSTSITKIESGYRGSVSSKQYRDTWKSELKEHPELFSVEIISTHDTRREATYRESQLQKMFNVVKSDLFVNLAYAQTNNMKIGLGCPPSENNKIVNRKRMKELADTGRHPIQLMAKSGALSTENQKNKIKYGMELASQKGYVPWVTTEQGKQLQSEFNKKRVSEGNHNFQSEEHKIKSSNIQKKKLAEGSHTFQNKEFIKNTSERIKNKNTLLSNRTLYLEIKSLYRDNNMKIPNGLNLKSDKALLELKKQFQK